MSKKKTPAQWKKFLILGSTSIIAITILLGTIGVIYINLIAVRIEQKVEQLRSARASKFFATFPAFEIGQRFSPRQLNALLPQLGYNPAKEGSLRPGTFQWQRSGPELSLRLHRRVFSGAGHSLSQRKVRILFEQRGTKLEIEEIVDGKTDRRLELIEHPPKQLGFFFAGRLRSQNSVPISEIPVSVRLAFIAIEDASFLEHHGVSLRGTLRALWTDLIAMKWVQGGSTITQQLMKNLFFSREKALTRKLKEALYAFVTEARHEKEEILEAYLNEIYLGQWSTHEIHGVSEASQYYFNQSIYDISLSQSATLAAMVKGPNLYNPHNRPELVLKRRNLVLNKMLEAGFILPSEHKKAVANPLDVVSPETNLNDAAYFMEFALDSLPTNYREKLDTDALSVYVSLNPILQETASRALSQQIQKLEKSFRTLQEKSKKGIPLQGAMLAIDVPSCQVLALQGGRNFREAPFNRVLQGKRQPGSLFKPFVYLTAFQSPPDGVPISGDLELQDTPFEWKYEGGQVWAPKNYDEKFRGPVTLREALQKSLNVPTAKLAQIVGLGPILENLGQSGIRSKLPRVPSISLGSAEVSPLELAEAYTTLARMGKRCILRAFSEIYDENQNLVFENKKIEQNKLDSDATFDTVQLLKGVLTEGTARSALRTGLPLSNFAGKTGTTNDYKDAWFVGFSPEILALVWVGYDAQENVGLSGSMAALPIWTEFMKTAVLFLSEQDFERP